MTTINSIIIDDEPKARVLLKAILKEYCPQVNVVTECSDLPEGVKAIHKYKPDLIFLDIEMPGHSGLELLDFFPPEEVNFGVIFTTAYNEYALQAFRFSAIDYLLKPIQHQQLAAAVDRFIQRTEKMQTLQFQALQHNLASSANWDEKRIIVPNGAAYKLLKPQEVMLIKGDGAYSEIHLQDGSKLIASKNLKYFEEILFQIPFFFRSHKSYLINIQSVSEYVKSDGGYLVMKNGITAGISPDKVDAFLAKIQ
ncbi:MAG: LytR/AlgR family response regulator transcription factor [Ferruginibacter sp.]